MDFLQIIFIVVAVIVAIARAIGGAKNNAPPQPRQQPKPAAGGGPGNLQDEIERFLRQAQQQQPQREPPVIQEQQRQQQRNQRSEEERLERRRREAEQRRQKAENRRRREAAAEPGQPPAFGETPTPAKSRLTDRHAIDQEVTAHLGRDKFDQRGEQLSSVAKSVGQLEQRSETTHDHTLGSLTAGDVDPVISDNAPLVQYRPRGSMLSVAQIRRAFIVGEILKHPDERSIF